MIPAGTLLSFDHEGKVYYLYAWDFDFQDAGGDITYTKGATQGNAKVWIQLTSPDKNCTILNDTDASLDFAGKTNGTVQIRLYLPVEWGNYG